MIAEIAYQWGLAAAQSASRGAQREWGQFMTPHPIAMLMAKRAVESLSGPTVRVLEPAAGTGVLMAAAAQALLAKANRPSRIEILAYELDASLLPHLRATSAALTEEARRCGVAVHCVLRNEDFLLSALALHGHAVADLVIANPPYFKLSALDPRAVAHSYAVYGQPNIYGLFMAACSRLVRPGGGYCFLTPRSWTNGLYFKAVRRTLFERLSPARLHLFGSRTESFRDDNVLQETMIIWARASAGTEALITESAGIGELNELRERVIELKRLIHEDDQSLRLSPTDQLPASGWTESLGTLGLTVSTGPTVAFRAKDHLRSSPGSRTVPLLWMQHVHRSGVHWPGRREHEHIEANSATGWMLLHNSPMVLMRRFSPKEDLRRMTAVAYLGELPCQFLGLENHLNYVHRRGGALERHEAIGLAAVLGCQRVDDFLRGRSGNTQVNASDLRQLPLPGWGSIQAIGRALDQAGSPLSVIDEVVEREASTQPMAELRVA